MCPLFLVMREIGMHEVTCHVVGLDSVAVTMLCVHCIVAATMLCVHCIVAATMLCVHCIVAATMCSN